MIKIFTRFCEISVIETEVSQVDSECFELYNEKSVLSTEISWIGQSLLSRLKQLLEHIV